MSNWGKRMKIAKTNIPLAHVSEGCLYFIHIARSYLPLKKESIYTPKMVV